jgi:hypothetical protein
MNPAFAHVLAKAKAGAIGAVAGALFMFLCSFLDESEKVNHSGRPYLVGIGSLVGTLYGIALSGGQPRKIGWSVIAAATIAFLGLICEGGTLVERPAGLAVIASAITLGFVVGSAFELRYSKH